MAPPYKPFPFLNIKFENEEPDPLFSTIKILDKFFAFKIPFDVEVKVMFLYIIICDSALLVVNSPFKISVSPSFNLEFIAS